MSFFNQQRSNIYLILATIIFVVGISPHTLAQNESQTVNIPSIWIQAGPSATTLGLGFSAGLNARIQGHYFALKTNSTELSQWEETWDVSLLYGRHAQIRRLQFYAGTGFSVLGGTSYSSLFETTQQESFGPVIGFPLEGSVFWHPIRLVGFGVNVFANVNTEQPFGGIGINFRIGHFNTAE